jgi:hypothetical protein
MSVMTDTDSSPVSEPSSLLAILALLFLSWLFRALPKTAAVAVRARIKLGAPRLVALDPAEAAAASHLLGGVAADAMAEPERWQ